MFTIEDRRRIKSESGCADVTIRAFPHVSGASRARIERACTTLGIAVPGAPKPADATPRTAAA